MASALIDSNIPQLKLLSKGKVRDIYATSSADSLLFVASDRISAYDVILKNVIITSFRLSWILFDELVTQGHSRQGPSPYGTVALLV